MAWATATVLTTLAIVAAVAGSATTAVAAHEQGKAQEKAAKFNEAVQRNNATAAAQQAAYEAKRLRDRNARILGAQNAAVAKSGIDLSGSAADVIFDSQIQGEMDALAALYTGRVRAGAEEVGAMLSDSQASNARASSYYGVAGSILGGVGSAASGYGSYRRQNPKL